jgi:cell division protein FtsB
LGLPRDEFINLLWYFREGYFTIDLHEKHIEQLQQTLDKAEAHIKFLENEIRARGNT